MKLPPAERLVLIYLADMANGKRFCWPGQETIVRFTGLALRTVRSAIRRLSDRQLIRVEAKTGRAAVYHILRPETPANGAGVDESHPGKPSQGNGADLSTTPANGAGVVGGDPGTLRHAPRQMVPPTPANRPYDPLSTQEKKTLKPARASEAGEAASGQRAEAAPSAAPSRPDQEEPPPVVETEASVDVTPIVRAVAASIRGYRSPQPTDPEQPFQPIHRGPVDPVRSPEEQIAILLGKLPMPAMVAAE